MSSVGEFVDQFEYEMSYFTKTNKVVAVVNGTSALQIALKLAGVENDNEVITQALTFVATANSILYVNSHPVFIDVDKDTMGLSPDALNGFLEEFGELRDNATYNKKTGQCISAIIPVHMWGNGVWLDDLASICEVRNIAVVEDACESLGTIYKRGKYKGKHTGTIGKLGCLSFNGNKIITTGGGGMILTDDDQLAEKARYLTTQAKDDPIRYIHNEIGYNYRLTNIQAAMGVAQLEQLPAFLESKRKFFNKYQTAINHVNGLTIADVPDYAKNNHWMILVQIDSAVYGEDREELMLRLDVNNIQTRPAWAPIHLQKPYQSYQKYRIEKAEELVA